jgi:hypothetical protein
MANLLDGWIDFSRFTEINPKDLNTDEIAENPDECALAAIGFGGTILRTAAEKRPDDATVQNLIANLMELQEQGDSVGGLGFSPEVLSGLVFDQDTALRYVRMLIHNTALCLDYTPEVFVGGLERADSANTEGVEAGAEIANEAAQLSAQRLSPYGVLMTMVGAACHHALNSGISPLQVIQGLTKHAQMVLNTTTVVPRVQENDSESEAGLREQYGPSPNIGGSWRFFTAMKWTIGQINPGVMTGIAPCLGVEQHGAGTVSVIAVGYVPTEVEGGGGQLDDNVLQVRDSIASFCATRNVDALTISNRPAVVSKGPRYAVIGDAFVRRGESLDRTWRPAVVWPGCTGIGAIIDLARSPFFEFNEPAYADPDGDIEKLLELCFSDV